LSRSFALTTGNATTVPPEQKNHYFVDPVPVSPGLRKAELKFKFEYNKRNILSCIHIHFGVSLLKGERFELRAKSATPCWVYGSSTYQHVGFYHRNLYVRFEIDTAKRPPTDTASQGKDFSPSCTGLHTFSHLFVLNVFNASDPAEA
jgi:hypothetical protein